MLTAILPKVPKTAKNQNKQLIIGQPYSTVKPIK
jgi:hypothetical protein